MLGESFGDVSLLFRTWMAGDQSLCRKLEEFYHVGEIDLQTAW